MLTRDQRLDAARASIDYITGRPEAEQHVEVTNCPGWTVYNAAAHVGRVLVAWEGMINSGPGEEGARDRAYEVSNARPHGAPMSDLRAWAHSAIDALEGPTRQCFFSMTGGVGDTDLWTWHAPSELGVHRLDVEAALGHQHAMSVPEAVDATTYAATYFLPMMRTVTEIDPGALALELLDAGGSVASTVEIASDAGPVATVRGPAVQVLLAVWGRPHTDVEVTGDGQVWAGWRELPSQAFQFGTWD